jgi:hypothetical protein
MTAQSLRFRLPVKSAYVTFSPLTSPSHRSCHASNCSSNLEAPSTACSLRRYHHRNTSHLIRGVHYPVLLRHTVCLASKTATPIQIPFHHPSTALFLPLLFHPARSFISHSRPATLFITAYSPRQPPAPSPKFTESTTVSYAACPPVALPIKEAHTPARAHARLLQSTCRALLHCIASHYCTAPPPSPSSPALLLPRRASLSSACFYSQTASFLPDIRQL